MHAGILTLQQVVMPRKVDVQRTALKSELKYLWMQEHDREALLVWVGTERTAQGNVSVWVSADGVIIRLLEGRLVGISEPLRSWHLIREKPLELGQNSDVFPKAMIQTSDQQPGFRIGVERHVSQVLRTSAPASVTWYAGTPDVRWFAEIDTRSGLQTAYFAVTSEDRAIAGQRCIESDWCVRWQSWPVTTSQAKQ
jgi:hypothetical protein